jgi:hypothetical protein
MSLLSTSNDRRVGAGRPPLRLLRSNSPAVQWRPRASSESRSDAKSRSSAGIRTGRSRILVASADPERRAAVLRDLSEALPADTQFGEAGAAWEVLKQAPSSGVVMLAGDLQEVTAESLMHVLGDRHPSLPVVALGVCTESSPAGEGRSASGAALAR